MLVILTPFFSPNIGGVETHLDDWVRYLSRMPLKTVVVTFQPITTDATAPPVENRGRVTIYRYRWIGRNLFHRLEKYPVWEFLYLTPFLLLCVLRTLFRLKKEKTVVHAHGLNAAVVGGGLKLIFRMPCIVSTHAVYDYGAASITARLAAKVLRNADKVLCLSKASIRQLNAFGVPKEKAGRYTYWVDQEKFRLLDTKACRKRLGVANAFTVLFVARLIPVKGVSLFLEIATDCPDWSFVIVGDGPMEPAVTAAAEKTPNLLFLGGVANDELPVIYNSVDALVVCSQYEEGFGRVIIEAMSCGCWVVAEDRGGIREALANGGGVLVAGGKAGYIQALESEAVKRHDRAEIASIARKYYSDRNAYDIYCRIDGLMSRP
jgi:glycosyltransferase involved in cell wall biosynthesis